jgi:predicted nuclease with TOPRIM domain
MTQECSPASPEEIRQFIKELKEQEARLNQRLVRLANALKDYGVFANELTKEETRSKEELTREISETLDAIRKCSVHQAQFNDLLAEKSSGAAK